MQCDTEFEHQLGICSGTEEDFEFAGSMTFRLRGPCWTIFSGAPCNTFNFCHTQRFVFMSIRPLSGWDSTAREISEPFQVRSHSREKASFFPAVCLSVRLSPRTSAGPTGRNSVKLEIGEYHENLPGNPKFS